MLSGALDPVAGSAVSALVVVVATVAVRAALVPLGVIRMRAELARRRLAPRIRELRRRWSGEQLQRRLADLHRRERVSPFAGLWPTLAQLPVVGLVWGVFTHAEVAGRENPLFADALFGAALESAPHTAVVAGGPALAVAAVLLATTVAIATLTRRQSVRMLDPGLDEAGARVARLAAAAPFVSVPVVATVPLAAGLYLVISAGRALAERAVLAGLLDRGRATG